MWQVKEEYYSAEIAMPRGENSGTFILESIERAGSSRLSFSSSLMALNKSVENGEAFD